jgi:2Fe-2S ferredoxin
MARVVVVDRDGAEHQVDAATGQSMMEVLRDSGDFGVAAICGGLCSCATCHIHVDSAWLPKLKPRHNDEAEILVVLGSYDPAQSRLACQIPFTPELEGIKVTVAPEE